jgi:ParB family chromosome partitioning protein
VPGEGLEPSRLAAEGFESSAYTIPPPRRYRHRTLASAHRKAMRGCYNSFIMADANYVPTKYDSVFWVPTERIQPNPYQPRREFDEERLKALAESIRQYGVLQPLVVTRSEVETQAGGLQSTYELIAGERRLRASKLIGLKEVPVIIRVGEQTDGMKLELAIIENVQREDLNSIDRAKALAQLATEFGLSHGEIGAKVGRSREYVSNSIRLLLLPDAIQQAVVDKEITEGHARALLMLNDKPEERDTLFKEIVLKKTSVRMVEQLARRLAQDKIRKHDKTPEMMALEKSLTETLGTRVLIENRPKGGRVLIEFFSPEDLSHIAQILAERNEQQAAMSREAAESVVTMPEPMPVHPNTTQLAREMPEEASVEEDLYAVSSFSV